MTRLDHYLQHGASLAAWHDGALVADHPALLVWQDDWLGFWWLQDTVPHMFAIENKREHGDEVRLEHAAGALVLTPLPVYDVDIMKAWRKWLINRTLIEETLGREIAESQRSEGGGQRAEGSEGAYRVMLHYVPDATRPKDQAGWVLGGVWAADDEAIAYWGNPALVHMTSFWQATIQEGLENGGAPGGIFDYWLSANEQFSRRTLYAESFKASSAGAAAKAVYEAVV